MGGLKGATRQQILQLLVSPSKIQQVHERLLRIFLLFYNGRRVGTVIIDTRGHFVFPSVTNYNSSISTIRQRIWCT